MIEKKFAAVVPNLQQVNAFVEQTLEDKCKMTTMMKIAVAVEEIFVNIASYAYKDTVGDVIIAIDSDDHQIRITFRDQGAPFDPLAHEDPNVTLSVEQRGIGGLGIYMVKKTMDEVYYAYEKGENRFEFVKYID